MSQGWLERLVSCGFERSGSWILDDAHRARFHAEIEIPKQPGVYAYAVDGEICYIGSAQRGLHRRLRHYEKTKTLRTAFRIRGLIANELGEERNVIALTIVSDPISWKGLPIDPIAGLEVGLIRAIQPKWNIRELGFLRKKARAANSNQPKTEDAAH
jgi:hypothetical protein